jgi:nitroreductase
MVLLVNSMGSECLTSRRQVLERMLEAAILAPTAENVQHWRFTIGEDRFFIGLDENRGSASDVGGMLVLTGMGTAIENAVIAARHEGFEPEVRYVNKSEDRVEAPIETIAEVALEEAGAGDPLFEAIEGRCTSRRMKPEPLKRDILAGLAENCSGFSNVRIDWVTEPGDLRMLARLVGAANQIRFEHEPFHREFYGNMRFSREEVLATRDGLDVATLQLPPGVGAVLKLLCKWPRMKAANWLGFSRTVARQAAAEVRSSGAVGILTVDDADSHSFIDGGRALERIWLATTLRGLGFHPAAALPVFLAYATRTDGSRLLEKHQRVTRRMSRQFDQLFPQLTGRIVQMVFRVGVADRPKVRSLRRSVEDFVAVRHVTKRVVRTEG